MTLSLSTMWAQQPRFEADMHDFVQAVRFLGYDAIEISHLTATAQFDRLLSADGAVVSSIHAPAPLVRDHANVGNSSLNLAAIDDDERVAAIDHTKHTIDRAAAAGVRYVVVHLGGVGNKMFDAELQLRRLYDSGTRDGERVEALRAECLRLRPEQAEPWLTHARTTLRELVEYAQPRGVAIGIENRLHYHEVPQPEEAAWLLADYTSEQAGYWHDVGHAEVQWRLGLVDKRAWLDTNGARCNGSHLHDVTGLADHRAPGNGDVDWSYIREGIPSSALRVLEINQGQPEADVAGAIPFLRERGILT